MTTQRSLSDKKEDRGLVMEFLNQSDLMHQDKSRIVDLGDRNWLKEFKKRILPQEDENA
jgi:hypothetical protein